MRNKYKIIDDYAVMNCIYQGKQVEMMIDICDLERLKFYTGTVSLTRSTSGNFYGYMGWQVQKKRFRLQFTHFIIGVPEKGYVVDHINRNTLDNRRCNLRFLKEVENHWNVSLNGRRQKGSHTTGQLHIVYTSFKGRMVYRVRISRNYKDYHIGYFETLEEAIKERDIALVKLDKGEDPSRKTSSGIKHIVKARDGWRFVVSKKNEKYSSEKFKTLEEAIKFKDDYFKNKEV